MRQTFLRWRKNVTLVVKMKHALHHETPAQCAAQNGSTSCGLRRLSLLDLDSSSQPVETIQP